MQNASVVNPKHSNSASSSSLAHKSGGHHRHSQILPDLNEHQMGKIYIDEISKTVYNWLPFTATNMASNEADLYDMECMSPLYATPPHSPSSELSSPGQLPSINNIVDCAGASGINGVGICGNGPSSSSGGKSALSDNHFARDTHMRIILGNLKENQASSSR